MYIRVRQDYLTSAEHRLRASATTVLVSSIPDKWLTIDGLSGLYDVFPGGIRNIWINRNYDPLLEKVRLRADIVSMLEEAETKLIRRCKETDHKNKEKAKAKRSTRKEKAEAAEKQNKKAAKIAQSEGVTAGDIHQVHHTVEGVVGDVDGRSLRPNSARMSRYSSHGTYQETMIGMGLGHVPVIGGGLAAVAGGVTKGVGRGLGLFEKAGDTVKGTVVGGGRKLDENRRNVLNETVETTNGFQKMDDDHNDSQPRVDTGISNGSRNSRPSLERINSDISDISGGGHAQRPPSAYRQSSYSIKHADTDTFAKEADDKPKGFGEHRGINDMQLDKIPYTYGGQGTVDYVTMHNNWWKFWKGPEGGFPSPQPHGYEESTHEKQDFGKLLAGTGAKAMNPIKAIFTTDPGPQHQYPPHINPDYKADTDAQWEKYIKKSQRPTHRLPRWGMPFLPYILPWVCEKVDMIYYCREELARLNVEIEYDQDHPEDYPRMNSAFIQFNHQIGAHLAAQAVNHHIPKHMSPRLVEISPTDVIWDNMSMKWWESWLRSGTIICIVTAMCILWAIPVSATTLLANIPALIEEYPWLGFLKGAENVIKPIAGVLPAIVLAILMILPPIIFYKLANMQGNQTGKLVELSVQSYYFMFLFIQVFLVVSVATGTLATLADDIKDVTKIPELLAKNLPKASNYFFSYMVIQALAVSAGNLLQIGSLLAWLVMPKLFDNTARQKWQRNTTLPHVQWGKYFPTYTNFACISLIYSPVAPLITVFAIVTFSVLWIANRYSMLYVYKHTEDTGGLLYPRAINQTFTGLYVMELCLIGLFLLVRDDANNTACIPQAIIMLIVLCFTVLFQVLLNKSFGPLLEHLPITLEDDAVLRDEAFERAQAARLADSTESDAGELHERNQQYDTDNEADLADKLPDSAGSRDENIEMRRLRRASQQNSEAYSNSRPPNGATNGIHKSRKFAPLRAAQAGAHWGMKGMGRGARGIGHGAKDLGVITFGNPDSLISTGPLGTSKNRKKDIEAQKLMGEALFGGYNDEIEDLTPEERDTLVRAAFQHEALRARRPNVWLPRDDLGVSDEEVRRTELFGMGNIWITNKGTALDAKFRVMYGKNPPDFSEVDLIVL